MSGLRSRTVWALLIVAAAWVAACADDNKQADGGGVTDARLELCDDNVDNDKDGKIDCADPDCAYAPQCSDGAVPPDLGRRDKGTPDKDSTVDKGTPDDKGIDVGHKDSTVDKGAGDTTVDTGSGDTTVDTGGGGDTSVDSSVDTGADQGAG